MVFIQCESGNPLESEGMVSRVILLGDKGTYQWDKEPREPAKVFFDTTGLPLPEIY